MSAECRCGLSLEPPDGWFWLPVHHPEPGPDVVHAVAVCGQNPAIMRWERVDGGWRCRGAAATSYESPPLPWEQVGRCWNGDHHPVNDVRLADR